MKKCKDNRNMCINTQINAAVYVLFFVFFEASLKFKLASETSKAVSQRDRIQQLQNSLIKVRKYMFH